MDLSFIGDLLGVINNPVGAAVGIALIPFLIPVITTLFVSLFGLVIKLILAIDDVLIDTIGKIPLIGGQVKSAIQGAYIKELQRFSYNLQKTIQKVKD